jgi:UDP:flavonoid glycosyltransferase YjiC (YdhE family)
VARFLFVVPPLTGHVNPTVAVGRELVRRGHAVAWAGYPKLVAPLLDPGSELIELGEDLPDEMIEATRARATALRGVAALEFLWREFLCPLAVAMVPGVERAVEAFAPDVLVVDQQAFAGAVVARKRGLRWATSATTSAELVDPFADLPKVGWWVREQLVDLQLRSGVDEPAARAVDLRFSPHLVLAFTTAELAGPLLGLPQGTGPVALVGPSIRAPGAGGERPADDFPWDWLQASMPCVLVTLGTVSAAAGSRFFTAAIEGAAGSGWQLVIVAPPDLIPDPPAAVLVRRRVPQLELLDHVSAVVCHAGHNTVCESLDRSIPLVVAPIRDDQPIVADQVVRAGAGLRVRFGRVAAPELGSAIRSVLEDPAYRAAAARVQASFRAAGGAAAACDHLEVLAS